MSTTSSRSRWKLVAGVAADGNRETARLIEQAGGQSLAVSCDVRQGHPDVV